MKWSWYCYDGPIEVVVVKPPEEVSCGFLHPFLNQEWKNTTKYFLSNKGNVSTKAACQFFFMGVTSQTLKGQAQMISKKKHNSFEQVKLKFPIWSESVPRADNCFPVLSLSFKQKAFCMKFETITCHHLPIHNISFHSINYCQRY